MRGGSVNTMKSIRNSILVIVILPSLSAGAVKLMKMPQEVKFFHDAGLGVTLLVILGTVIAAGSFLASTVVIFMTGQVGFGFFSLLPVVLAGLIVTWSNQQRPIEHVTENNGQSNSNHFGEANENEISISISQRNCLHAGRVDP